MDKKWGLIILICIIVIGVGVFVFNSNFSNNTQFQVGSTNFKLPQGYVVGTPNEFGAVNITDGKYSVFLVEYDDMDVKKHINEYQKFIKNKNQTISVLNSTVEGIFIQKAYNTNNPNNVHYWVVKNNKTYEMYKWDENPKMDYIVSELIKSLNNE